LGQYLEIGVLPQTSTSFFCLDTKKRSKKNPSIPIISKQSTLFGAVSKENVQAKIVRCLRSVQMQGAEIEGEGAY